MYAVFITNSRMRSRIQNRSHTDLEWRFGDIYPNFVTIAGTATCFVFAAAVMHTLIQTAKLNDVDPQAWPADAFAHIDEHNVRALDQLLPWNWKLSVRKLVA